MREEACAGYGYLRRNVGGPDVVDAFLDKFSNLDDEYFAEYGDPQGPER